MSIEPALRAASRHPGAYNRTRRGHSPTEGTKYLDTDILAHRCHLSRNKPAIPTHGGAMSTTSIGSVTLSIESPVVLKQGEDSLVSMGITGDVLPQPLPDRYEGEPLPFPERMSLYVSGEQWTGV